MYREKRALRRHIRRVISTLPAATRRNADAAVAERLTALSSWREAREILLFHSLPDEISTLPLLREAIAAGKRLYLPRIVGSDMEFGLVATAGELEGLRPERFGIVAPATDTPSWRPGDRGAVPDGGCVSLIVCPGRAFDVSGNRLGRGGGYYDRFLATLPELPGLPSEGALVQTVGICYEVQLVPAVPAESKDQRVGMIVTEDRFVTAD